MKYFAKELPIKDEIQERVKSLYSPSHKEYKASKKLFLCSRDIQVGDKDVYAEPDAVEGWRKGLRFEVTKLEDLEGYRNATIKYLANPIMPESVGNEREWPADNLWKVIGEISPEATWIKEGDEFDEKDLSFMRVDRENGGGWKYTTVEDCKGFPTMVEIKGPCGHFH